MKLLLVILMALSLELPIGSSLQFVLSVGNHDEVPAQLPAEEVTDSAELLDLIDLLYTETDGTILVSAPVCTFPVITSPSPVASPTDRESHFCRPPPACV